MKKVFQTVYGLFRKSKDNISKSLNDKESDKAAEEFIQKSNEIKAELQKKIEKTNQELQERFQKKEPEEKSEKKPSNKNKDVKKTNSNNKVSQKKKTPSKNEKVNSSKTSSKKTTTKKTSTTKTKSKKKEMKYPSGLIVNSQILTSAERGYLELGGYKNYKDVLINLSTPSKRTKIAKEVTTTPGVLHSIVKKIELLQVKGVSENTVESLLKVGIDSKSKLQKANIETTLKKVEKFKKQNPKEEISLGQKQLENIITNSNE